MSNIVGKGRFFTLLGLLAGAAAGAAVALIYSPHNGEKNREQLNQWAHNRLEDAQRRVEKGN
jgi:gas vesicle protein